MLIKWHDPKTEVDHFIIPKASLKDGHYYTGHCRNANLARWDAKAGCFKHWREKFGTWFIETILHPEDDDGFDVFIVQGYGCPPEGIPLD
jgi:hypothetical protein